MEQADSAFRYIDAADVETPSGRLDGTVVVAASDEAVGALEGVIIDLPNRRLLYFVVRSRRLLTTRRQLVPATPARLDVANRRLHVDIEPNQLRHLREVGSDTFERFSDDDMIAAMFSPHAA